MSSYKIGRDFEKRFAKKTGANLVPGSGSQWHSKLDAKSNNIIWSLKRSDKDRVIINNDLIKEIDRATKSPGGYIESYPAICVSAGDLEDLVVMKLDDFLAWQADEKTIEYEPIKKKKVIQPPELLR